MRYLKNIMTVLTFVFIFLFVSLIMSSAFNENRNESRNVLIANNKTVESGSTIDIVIVGSGPAGLSAAIQGTRSGFETLVIEGDNPGGQLMLTTDIENFPGYSSTILGPDLMHELKQQAKNFGSIFLRDSVAKIDFSSLPYKVHTRGGEIFYAKSLIIATGVSSERLGAIGENEYYGKGVNYNMIANYALYKDKNIVIVGGGDSAVEYARQLSSYAKKIRILVRSDKMRATSSSQENLKLLPNVTISYNALLKEITGNGTYVTEVKIEDKCSKKIYELKIEAVIIAIGNEPNTGFLKESLDLDKNGYIKLSGKTQTTSVTGVFAAGDVTEGRAHLAIVAAGDGTQAGFEAVSFLVNTLDDEEDKETDYMVCFCKGISYSKIVKAIKNGCVTFDDLRRKLGICTGCRSCKERIESILKSELEKKNS